METLMLNLNVTGQSGNGPGTSSGTFSITIEDATAKKIAPKSEEDAYPKIKSALGKDPETSVMNPGETGTIMVSDLFTVMDGYTASYGVSVEGGAVSVSASSDSITVTAGAVGESKVTVTARAKGMTAPSFLPEQTTSDVAHITFPRDGRGGGGAGAGAGVASDCAVAARSWPDGWRRAAAVSAAASGLVEPIVPESPGG